MRPSDDASSFAILYAKGRRNSVGFLRFVLAACVVLSHSFKLGGFGSKPLHRGTGETLGTFAVDAFFVLSGFLIARSFATSTSVWRYLWHRVLRIFPGYWTCLLVTAYVIGPLIQWSCSGHFRLRDYATSDPSPASYVAENFFLRTNQPAIDGLLSATPFPNYLNGALWSLEHEFRCYLGVALLGLAGLFGARRLYGRASAVLLFVGLLVTANSPSLLATFSLDEINVLTIRLAVWFMAGVVAYVFAERIPVNRWLFVVSVIGSGVAYATKSQHLIGPLTVTYALFFLAIRLPLEQWDRRADLSYGVYVYAFPIQQLLATTSIRKAGVAVYFACSLLLACVAAASSWFAIERPALRLKNLFRKSTTSSAR